MLMNIFIINEPVHVYYLVVVSSNTKTVVVIIRSAFKLITSAYIHRSAVC